MTTFDIIGVSLIIIYSIEGYLTMRCCTKSESLLPGVLETVNELIVRYEYGNMGLGEWDCNSLHIWEYMIVWIGTSQEPNRDRGCTSISSLKLKYKIFRDKQLSNLLNAGLGRLKRPSKGQGYCHPKLWWRDMVMVYCRIFDTGCFEHVSQNKRCAQESARRSNFLLPHRRIIMGHYIAHKKLWDPTQILILQNIDRTGYGTACKLSSSRL